MRNNFRILLAVLMLAPLCAWSQSSVYRTVDEDGNVVFTDAPPAGVPQTERVEITPTNTTPPVVPREEPVVEAEPEEPAELEVTIVSPQNETTIAMGPGNFSVSASVSGGRQASPALQLFMDGIPQGEPQRDTSWDLTNVFRGAHDLTVSALDGEGNTMATSEPVRVYVLRPSINFRN